LIGLVIFSAPENRMVQFSGHTAQMYYPKAKTVEIYDVGKYQGAMDRWLALGFGTTGADLKKDYEIKVVGPEKIDSTPTTRLQLTPRSGELKKLLSTVDLWIPIGLAHPIREKAVFPSKDYRLVDYSEVKTNQSLPNSDFELKLPGDVKKSYPGK
jgi:outer membrane lipoprotein-sorting protein